MKLIEEEFIDSKVVDYLSSINYEEKSHRVVLMEIKNELFESTDYYKKQMATIELAQYLIEIIKNKREDEKNLLAQNGISIEKQKDKIRAYTEALEKERDKFIRAGYGPSAYFTKSAYRRANKIKAERCNLENKK